MKTCPECGEELKRNPHKTSFVKRFSLTFLGELSALLLACVLITVISALTFGGAYAFGLLLIFGLGITIISTFRNYKCTKCDKIFAKEDIQTT